MKKLICFNKWSEEDLEDLDAKFDALCEHLGVEFVFERLSDGSKFADTERCHCRDKQDKGVPVFGWDSAKDGKDQSVLVTMRRFKDGSFRVDDVKEL